MKKVIINENYSNILLDEHRDTNFYTDINLINAIPILREVLEIQFTVMNFECFKDLNKSDKLFYLSMLQQNIQDSNEITKLCKKIIKRFSKNDLKKRFDLLSNNL